MMSDLFTFTFFPASDRDPGPTTVFHYIVQSCFQEYTLPLQKLKEVVVAEAAIVVATTMAKGTAVANQITVCLENVQECIAPQIFKATAKVVVVEVCFEYCV